MVVCKLLNSKMQKGSKRIRNDTCNWIILHYIEQKMVFKKIEGCRGSKPFELDPPLSASSAETSERSSSALISAFVFTCGIEQSANALSPLSLQVLHSKKKR